MKILHRSRKGGFTLIELLVVIAIIAILTGIIITNLVASKAKSRDAKRASDLAQISLAIEQYFDRCDQYPADIVNLSQALGCPSSSNVTLGSFISKIPTDPSSGSSYDYATNLNISGNTSPTDYVLHTTFETGNSVSNQSAPAPTWLSSVSGITWTCPTNPSSTNLSYCVRPN